MANQLKYIQNNVFDTLSKHENVAPFKEPVDPVTLNIPRYYDFVKKPMDLKTIRERLKQSNYLDAKDCCKDFFQMFNNCYVYNPPETPLVDSARHLELAFIRKLSEMPDVEQELSLLQQEAGVSVPLPEENGTHQVHLEQQETQFQPPLNRLRPRLSIGKPVTYSDSASSPVELVISSSEEESNSESEHDVFDTEEDNGAVFSFLKKSKELRKKQMKSIQAQMKDLQLQLQILHRQETEDIKLTKKLKDQHNNSANKAKSKAEVTPRRRMSTSSCGADPGVPKKKPKTDFVTHRTPKKKISEPAQKVEVAVDKSQPIPLEQLEVLVNMIGLLNNTDMEDAFGILDEHCPDGEITAISLSHMPCDVQWELHDIVTEISKNVPMKRDLAVPKSKAGHKDHQTPRAACSKPTMAPPPHVTAEITENGPVPDIPQLTEENGSADHTGGGDSQVVENGINEEDEDDEILDFY